MSRRGLYTYAYRRSADQDAAAPVRHPVVVVGAGPVGLTAAIDLASRGVSVVLLDDADRIGEGSRGICYAKRSLEIWDRLGVGERLRDMGVTWKLGKVFVRDELAYAFDLLPEDGHKMPAFINLQQYELEKVLVDRALDIGGIDLRWKNRVSDVVQRNDGVRLTVATPDGPYDIDAEWVIAADGARSTVRERLGLAFAGVQFEDKFLIADIRMEANLPTERRFWFDPTFHSGQSALMHRQPGNVWRIDLQLGQDAAPEVERQPENVIPRIRRILGEHQPFELEWVSVYRFNCCRLDRFVHGRVVFAGDAAHQVSPFGARGGNSGVQDAENIAWKLAAVLDGSAGPGLIDSYDIERTQAADENIAHSTRSIEFIAPRSQAERTMRNAVLALAPKAAFARRMVNSGRLSTATTHVSPLSTADEESFGGSAELGAPVPDVPVRRSNGGEGFLLEGLGSGFTVLHAPIGECSISSPNGVDLRLLGEDVADPSGSLMRRLDVQPGSTYLVRPDHHLCARWRRFDREKIEMALRRARGH